MRLHLKERMRAAQALEHSRNSCLRMLDDFPNLIWRSSPDTKCDYFNKAWLQFTGRTLQQEVGDGWAEGVHPEDLERCVHTYLGAFHAREPFEMEYRLRYHTGEYRWIVDFGMPFQDADGSFVGYIGSCYDLTERKRTEESLRLLRSALEAAANAAVITDREGTIIWTNPAFTSMTGYSPDEAVGQTPRLVKSGTHEEAFYERLWATILSGRVWKGEVCNRRKDGSLYMEEMTIAPVADDEGQITHYVAIKQDITERMQWEIRARQAQKLESLGILAGGIAHRFNNLLAAIMGQSGLAAIKLPPTSPALAHIERLDEATQQAAELAKQMLAYSGKGHFLVQPLDLSLTAREVAPLLESGLPKHVSIEYNFAKGLPPVDADPGQMRQVVVNLITNAAEAIGDTDGTITIVTETRRLLTPTACNARPGSDLPAGDYVGLCVSDTGCGMDADTVRKVFDPFFSTKFTGRGLGLAAVQGIVRGHGGGILVESQPGDGSTFTLLFPARQWSTAPVVEHTPANDGWRGSGTVLLVDDEDAVREAVGEVLKSLGFDVLTARNGREGVDAFQQHADEIAVTLLDLTMPMMDGAAVFQEIRRFRPDARVVLSSGYGEEEAKRRFTSHVPAAFIQKPYRPEALRRVLQSLLNPGDSPCARGSNERPCGGKCL